jgi:hypothetical protein
MQLELDPFIEPHCPHFLHIARPWAEGEPIQGVDYLLIGCELAVIESRLG